MNMNWIYSRAELFFAEAIQVQSFEPHPEYVNSLQSLVAIYESRHDFSLKWDDPKQLPLAFHLLAN